MEGDSVFLYTTAIPTYLLGLLIGDIGSKSSTCLVNDVKSV